MIINAKRGRVRVAFLPNAAVVTEGSKRRHKRLIRMACAKFGTKEVRFRPSAEVGRWILATMDGGISVEEIG